MPAPPPAREEVLVSTLSELGKYWLGLSCAAPCSKFVYYPLKLMAQRHGHQVRLAAALAQLRCSECQRPPAAAWLVDYPVEGADHGGRGATWRVDLISP